MKTQESDLQIACVQWFRMQYPVYSDVFFAIPNGGKRNVITATILKKEGVLAGVADIFLDVPKKGFHGLRIEMKTPKGTQQNTQKAFQAASEKQGYKYIICRSIEQFMDEINNYLR